MNNNLLSPSEFFFFIHRIWILILEADVNKAIGIKESVIQSLFTATSAAPAKNNVIGEVWKSDERSQEGGNRATYI